jgi:hypothetical protein
VPRGPWPRFLKTPPTRAIRSSCATEALLERTLTDISLMEFEGNYTRLHFCRQCPSRRSLADGHRAATQPRNIFFRANRSKIATPLDRSRGKRYRRSVEYQTAQRQASGDVTPAIQKSGGIVESLNCFSLSELYDRLTPNFRFSGNWHRLSRFRIETTGPGSRVPPDSPF